MTHRTRRAFTLVEILIVLAIILLVTVIAAPRIYSALNGRQVTDGARVFTGALAGIRDAAIKANEPRGIRLLPDPLLTLPAPGFLNSGETQLVFNRLVPIEPAGDYTEGRINIGPKLPFGVALANFPPLYPRDTGTYPFYSTGALDPTTGLPLTSKVLMVEESLIAGGFTFSAGSGGSPNPPTNWWWTIRVGDRIKLHGTGRAYTIVGPLTISPWGTGAAQGNYELFVNAGPPGTKSPLQRSYYTSPTAPPTPGFPEFLFVVNGEDDDGDGYVDEGWNGYDEPRPNSNPPPAEAPNGLTDELTEWEAEAWTSAVGDTLDDNGPAAGAASPTADWIATKWAIAVQDIPYTIQRQPVPTAGAREIALPRGVVIDATTWNTTRERSRLPVLPGSCYCDIMLNPNGQYIPTTIYSTPTSAGENPFLHFWLTDSSDVHPRGSVWGMDANGPRPNPSGAGFFELPMPTDAMGVNSQGAIVAGPGFYPPSVSPTPPILKGDRRLVTLFPRNGMIVTNTIEAILPPPPVPPMTVPNQPGEGFNVADVNYPYLKAQSGQREAR